MRTQDIEYQADGVRMVGQYVVDDASRARGPACWSATRGRASPSTPRRSPRGLPGWAMPPSPWTITAAASRSPIPPTPGRASAPGSPTRPASGPAPWPRSRCSRRRRKSTPTRLAAIGYCFGGTTALEIGRSGADLKAIVGFHSGLVTVRPQDARNIKGKVLVCIGADDPIIPPEQRAAFENEMKAAGIDWRLQLYGGAGHSFTNPAADSRGMQGLLLSRGHRPAFMERHDRAVQRNTEVASVKGGIK